MDFDELLKELRKNLLVALGDKYSEYSNQSKKDIDAFLKVSKVKLKRWTILLAEGQLTEDDLEWLVISQKESLILEALYQTGTSKIALGHLKNKIIKIVVETVKVAVLV